MHKNNFADRFVEEFRTNLLTKEKIADLGVHVIVMFTFVSTLYFYITSPSIAYTFQYAITLFFDSLGINYSFNGSCPNNKNVKDETFAIYKDFPNGLTKDDFIKTLNKAKINSVW